MEKRYISMLRYIMEDEKKKIVRKEKDKRQ